MEYSPPRRGGVAAASTKSCEATESAADGVVSSAKSSGLKCFAELTTPAAPFWKRIHFYLGAYSPPLRGGEYVAKLKRMKFFERYCTLTFGWTAIVRFWDSVNGRAK